MTVKKLYCELEKLIPKSLSYEWDNDGLSVCPNENREVNKVLIALDPTDEVVDKAINGRYDLIITHHPLLFKGLKNVNGEGLGKRVIKLIKHDISLMSFHTRFDAVDGGVNDILSFLFDLQYKKKIALDGIEIGRMGRITRLMTVSDFALLAKEKLHAPRVLYSDGGNTPSKIAIMGGSADDFVETAIENGADTLLCGTVSYHKMAEAKLLGINIVSVGHYYSENPSLVGLAQFVNTVDKEIKIDFTESRTVETV